MKYPLVKTMIYDTTQVYEEGQEVYIYQGQFTTKPGPPSPPNSIFKPLAVVKRPPTKEQPEMELLIVGEDWSIGAYERHKILTEIVSQREHRADAKLVVVPPDVMEKIQEHCADVFEPAVRDRDLHIGRIYGLLVYVSFAAKRIEVR